MTIPRSALVTLTSAALLGLSACGSGVDPEDPQESTSSTASGSGPSESTSGSDGSSPSDGGGLDEALAAIDAAEAETGGTAYEIEESDDDGIWEIDVAKDAHSVEIEVKPNRDVTEHGGTDLHAEAREGLDHAEIDLGPAIDTAMSEVEGTFDKADLIEINGQHYWKVTVDTAPTEEEDDDHRVLVDVTNGEVSVSK